MDLPILYKWNVSRLSLEVGDIFHAPESHTFTLNGTDIKFCLILEFPFEEVGETHYELYLKLLNLAGETSVAVQFRLWLENGVGKKITKNPFVSEFTHNFTRVREQFGVKEFMLQGRLFSAETDFDKYHSINFCCEVLRIKPDSGFLADFKLREENYSLYKSGIIDNCVLKANNQDFNVPKSLLMASSQVFMKMFTSHTKEARSNTVKVEGVSSEVVEGFIKHLYVGKLDESDQLVEELFVFADRYIVENLMDICIKTLVETLMKENVARRLKLAFMYNNFELRNHMLFYLTNYGAKGNFYEMLKSDGWHSLTGENKELADEIVDAYSKGTKSL